MKRILFCCVLLTMLGMLSYAQTVNLTFTACDTNNRYVRLDRVVIDNLTQGWQETLYWPDTILTMTLATGLDDVIRESNHLPLQLLQNTPNPFDGTTYTTLILAKSGDVSVEITDVAGRIVETHNITSLQKGIHQLRITLSTSGVYFLTARQNGQVASVKMVNHGKGGASHIDIVGNVGTQFIASETNKTQKSPKSVTNNPFVMGDQMMYVGYATINNEEVASYSIEQAQDSTQTLVLLFNVATGVEDGQPCPGTPTVTDYDGNVYNTVKIGNQCWIRENLRTTHYADGTFIPVDSNPQISVGLYCVNPPYRYAPNGDTNNVSIYGWLYNWYAVMNGENSSYANPSGVQGVCPEGWHVPGFYEWDELGLYVKQQSAFVCGDTNLNVGKSLAAAELWESFEGPCCVGNTVTTNNATGFSALPAGFFQAGSFSQFGREARFSSSSNRWEDVILIRDLYHDQTDFAVYFSYANDGISVRCVRD